MNNNDILRRLRYAFKLSDKQMLVLFAKDPQSQIVLGPKQLSSMMQKEDASDFRNCTDQELAAFLDGFIVSKRGLKPEQAARPRVTRLSKNEILKKLRIALNLRDDAMLQILAAGGTRLSKSELSAFFRNPHHKHFRPVGNQVLRNFIKGLIESA